MIYNIIQSYTDIIIVIVDVVCSVVMKIYYNIGQMAFLGFVCFVSVYFFFNNTVCFTIRTHNIKLFQILKQTSRI